ncbi:MAG: hypothetical protein AB7I38_17020 [Dehalococcoidia bacterium]
MPVFAETFAWCSPREFKRIQLGEFRQLVAHLARKHGGGSLGDPLTEDQPSG